MICKICGSDRVIKYGFNRIKYRKKQKYLCKECKVIFSNPNCLKGFKKTKRFMGRVIDCYNDGLSFYKIAYRFKISSSTAYNWFMKLPNLLKKEVEKRTQKAKLSSTRHADETELPMKKIKLWNKEKKVYQMVEQKVYLWAMVDNVTRFVNIFHISYKKNSEACEEFLKKSTKHPRAKYIVTDEAFSYKEPLESVFNKGNRNKQRLKHIAITKSDPRFKQYRGFNNLIERVFQTTKSRTKVTRRYKKISSINNLVFMFFLNYNFLKPNRTIKKTPADKANIGINLKRLGFYDLMKNFGMK